MRSMTAASLSRLRPQLLSAVNVELDEVCVTHGLESVFTRRYQFNSTSTIS